MLGYGCEEGTDILKRNAMTRFMIAFTTMEQVQQNVITDTRKIIDLCQGWWE